MPRIDRLIPPVALNIINYDTEYMETYHKRTYKSFLAIRQHIGTEYEARAPRQIVDGNTYYHSYSLLNNILSDSEGYELLKWHGMPEESIAEIIQFHYSTDLEYLRLAWEPRRIYNEEFFLELAPIVSILIAKRYGEWVTDATEADIVRPIDLTNEEKAVWDIYFGFSLFILTDDNGEISLVEDIAQRIHIEEIHLLALVEQLPGDMPRVKAGVSMLNSSDATIFEMTEPTEVPFFGYLFRNSILSKKGFETISQDNFFDIYATACYIDYEVDETWFEEFIGGLLTAVGKFLNFLLDVLLDMPLDGFILEWIIEGVASLFNMTLDEARAAVIKAIIFVVALYFTAITGGSSLYAYVNWMSSAYSLAGFAGDLAESTYESPVEQIENIEKEKIRRELEEMQTELTLSIGRAEPEIRINRPEEELKVDGDNNSTYNIFKLD